MDPKTLDILVKTVLGEARGEGLDGMAAVAHVIRNRANSGMFSSDPARVALEPKQFSTWNSGEGGNNPQQFRPGTKAYNQAARVVEAVFAGQFPDTTGGALFYHSTGVKPNWASSVKQYGTEKIGNHVFYPTRPIPPGEVPQVASLLDTVAPAPMPVTSSPGLSALRSSPPPLPIARPPTAPSNLISQTMASLSAGRGSNLGDSLALSPISGGRQSAPPFDAAYDTRTGQMRMLAQPEAVSSQGMGVGTSAAPAPLPAMPSPQLAGRRATDPVLQAALNSRYPTQLPTIPDSTPVSSEVIATYPTVRSPIGQPPATRIVQSVPMPASRPQSYAGQDAAPPRQAAPASTRTASPTSQTEIQRLASIYGGGGPTRPPLPSNEDRLLPTPDIPDLSAGPTIPSTNPIQIIPNPSLTAQTNSVPKDFTGQYDQYGNPVFKPSLAAAPPMPLPRPTDVATQISTTPPLPRVPQTAAPIAPAIPPTPMPRLDRPGIFGNPQLFGRDIKLPGILGMVQGATKALANASGPFNNGVDNLLYNTMRGGDFNTPGAATAIGANGYLYAPKQGGGYFNVGRVNPAISNADLYESLRARNPQNAADRMRFSSSRFDSDNGDSIFG